MKNVWKRTVLVIKFRELNIVMRASFFDEIYFFYDRNQKTNKARVEKMCSKLRPNPRKSFSKLTWRILFWQETQPQSYWQEKNERFRKDEKKKTPSHQILSITKEKGASFFRSAEDSNEDVSFWFDCAVMNHKGLVKRWFTLYNIL